MGQDPSEEKKWGDRFTSLLLSLRRDCERGSDPKNPKIGERAVSYFGLWKWNARVLGFRFYFPRLTSSPKRRFFRENRTENSSGNRPFFWASTFDRKIHSMSSLKIHWKACIKDVEISVCPFVRGLAFLLFRPSSDRQTVELTIWNLLKVLTGVRKFKWKSSGNGSTFPI